MLTGNRSQTPTQTAENATEDSGDTQSEQAQEKIPDFSLFFAVIRLCDLYLWTLLATEVA
jgi:hypothetical protein